MVQNWTLDAGDVVALPLDELALLVLRNAHDYEESNWNTWLMSFQRQNYSGQAQARQALTEAWDWIRHQGLITSHPTQSAHDAFVLSRKGHETLERGLDWVRAVARLDVALLPVLERKARPQFLRGDFEMAALAAMKQVEVEVRAKAALAHQEVGVKLMRNAFGNGGPLFQPALNGGEADAMRELFSGAIGLFRNPVAHWEVDFDDPTEAAEIVLLADLLLRLLRKIPAPSGVAVPAAGDEVT